MSSLTLVEVVRAPWFVSQNHRALWKTQVLHFRSLVEIVEPFHRIWYIFCFDILRIPLGLPWNNVKTRDHGHQGDGTKRMIVVALNFVASLHNIHSRS